MGATATQYRMQNLESGGSDGSAESPSESELSVFLKCVTGVIRGPLFLPDVVTVTHSAARSVRTSGIRIIVLPLQMVLLDRPSLKPAGAPRPRVVLPL